MDESGTGLAAQEDLRASDAERERVAAALRDHAAEGRLDMGELGERLEGAYSARTRNELGVLTSDLPDPQPPTSEKSGAQTDARRELRDHAGSFVLVNLLLIGIWAATGADYFWPIWPLLGWGAAVASQAASTLLGRPLPVGHCSGGHRARHRRRRVG